MENESVPKIDFSFFLAFSENHDPELAKQKFRERYHREPDICLVEKHLLWVGPIHGPTEGKA